MLHNCQWQTGWCYTTTGIWRNKAGLKFNVCGNAGSTGIGKIRTNIVPLSLSSNDKTAVACFSPDSKFISYHRNSFFSHTIIIYYFYAPRREAYSNRIFRPSVPICVRSITRKVLKWFKLYLIYERECNVWEEWAQVTTIVHCLGDNQLVEFRVQCQCLCRMGPSDHSSTVFGRQPVGGGQSPVSISE
jgi:hypothetical protein